MLVLEHMLGVWVNKTRQDKFIHCDCYREKYTTVLEEPDVRLGSKIQRN